jgi:hypothetical protein
MTRPDYQGDEAGRCGGCGSRNMTVISLDDGVLHGLCRDCERHQELETRDWPLSKMCDNCAFRLGSPERSDPYRWSEICEILREGREFHCHKGLPLDPKTGQFSPPDPKQGRVTICAGWLAAFMAQCKREEPA